MRIIRVIAFAAACSVIGISAVPSAATVKHQPVAGSTAASAAVDWKQFRFDGNHTGVNPSETLLNPANVRTLRLSWQAQLGQLVDFSSPAVVRGAVYIGVQ